MQIGYCDKCGYMISDDDIAKGKGVQLADGQTLCANCAPAQSAPVPRTTPRGLPRNTPRGSPCATPQGPARATPRPMPRATPFGGTRTTPRGVARGTPARGARSTPASVIGLHAPAPSPSAAVPQETRDTAPKSHFPGLPAWTWGLLAAILTFAAVLLAGKLLLSKNAAQSNEAQASRRAVAPLGQPLH